MRYISYLKKFYLIALIAGFCFHIAPAAVLEVGPDKDYAMPSDAADEAENGDSVLIDAGDYEDCTYWGQSNITIIGVGGRPHVRDASCQGKGIWIFGGDNIRVQNIEFSGATVEDENGAGIRHDGGSIFISNCYFHHNENGILASGGGSDTILVEYSEFAYNGFGDGYTHNMYMGNFGTFILRYSYSHHAKIGHNVKSRANENIIMYNRIMDEADGTSSRDIDLPNGGWTLLLGNVIQQGEDTDNSEVFGYGMEGLSNDGPHEIYVVHNTFVNNRSGGTFISVAGSTEKAFVHNNIFAGSGTLVSGVSADMGHNENNSDIDYFKFTDPDNFDFHLGEDSPALNKAEDMGEANGYSLVPTLEYKNVADIKNRAAIGELDLGAFEYNDGTSIVPQIYLGSEKQLSNGIYFNSNSNVIAYKGRVYNPAGRYIRF